MRNEPRRTLVGGPGRILHTVLGMSLVLLSLMGGCSCSTEPSVHDALSRRVDEEGTTRRSDYRAQAQRADEAAAVPSNEQAVTNGSPDRQTDSRTSASAANTSTTESAQVGDSTGAMMATASRGDASALTGDTGRYELPPDQAEQFGADHLADSTAAAKRGDEMGAYQEALAAWQITRTYIDHPGCTDIAQRAMDLLKRYGETVSGGTTAVSAGGKRIKVE